MNTIARIRWNVLHEIAIATTATALFALVAVVVLIVIAVRLKHIRDNIDQLTEAEDERQAEAAYERTIERILARDRAIEDLARNAPDDPPGTPARV